MPDSVHLSRLIADLRKLENVLLPLHIPHFFHKCLSDLKQNPPGFSSLIKPSRVVLGFGMGARVLSPLYDFGFGISSIMTRFSPDFLFPLERLLSLSEDFLFGFMLIDNRTIKSIIDLRHLSLINNRMVTGVLGPGGIWGQVQGVGSDNWGTKSQPRAGLHSRAARTHARRAF